MTKDEFLEEFHLWLSDAYQEGLIRESSDLLEDELAHFAGELWEMLFPESIPMDEWPE